MKLPESKKGSSKTCDTGVAKGQATSVKHIPAFWFDPEAQALALVPLLRTGATCAFWVTWCEVMGAEFSFA
jgi:hypothetical protein